jgi:hypothetical protein
MTCIRTDCHSGQQAIWMPCIILARKDVLGGMNYHKKLGEARFPAPFCDDCARRSFVSDLVTDRVWLTLMATMKHQGQKEVPTRAETGIRWEPIDKALRIRDQAREAFEIRAEAPEPDRLIETV